MERYSQDRDFTRKLIRHDTWVIQGVPNSCETHLLLGREKALVIDPGENRRNIRKYIETFTDLPLIVAISHGSWDHTGSNGQFSDCPIYMSPFSTTECKQIHPGLDPDDFSTDYEALAVEEGHIFDLGGRHIETVGIGCHNPGSYAYLDHEYHLLFTGDEIESGQVLIHQPWDPTFSTVERCLANMKKLKVRADEFDTLCPGHNGSPIDAEYIDFMIENCERILSGIEGKIDITSPTYQGRPVELEEIHAHPGLYRRSEWKGSSIVYCVNKIFNKN
jgi:hydroxyacylglutathione hydrolase